MGDDCLDLFCCGLNDSSQDAHNPPLRVLFDNLSDADVGSWAHPGTPTHASSDRTREELGHRCDVGLPSVRAEQDRLRQGRATAADFLDQGHDQSQVPLGGDPSAQPQVLFDPHRHYPPTRWRVWLTRISSACIRASSRSCSTRCSCAAW